jgi:hypothetical protein
VSEELCPIQRIEEAAITRGDHEEAMRLTRRLNRG